VSLCTCVCGLCIAKHAFGSRRGSGGHVSAGPFSCELVMLVSQVNGLMRTCGTYSPTYVVESDQNVRRHLLYEPSKKKKV
jgi:hypothetical protein